MPDTLRRHIALFVAVTAILILAASQAVAQQPEVSTAAASPPTSAALERDLLGSVEPVTAPGETLSLWYYWIPAGYQLEPHHHPGYQVARVTAGTLTFHVLEGEARVLRADGSTQLIGAGEVVWLEAGDSVVEDPGLAHFGANDGSVPVELYTATLFTSGEPPAIPLPSAAP